MWEAFDFLRWRVEACAEGRWPMRRHNNTAFTEGDEIRATRAGHDLIRAAVVHVKGDWAEFAHSFGLPPWGSVFDPCFCCVAQRDDLQSLGDTSPVSSPFPEKTAATYDEACAACERWVYIPDVRAKAALLGVLEYSKDFRGRAITRALPALGLEMGDRLEPSEALRDVGNVEEVATPQWLLFWRVPAQSAASHRNPLSRARG